MSEQIEAPVDIREYEDRYDLSILEFSVEADRGQYHRPEILEAIAESLEGIAATLRRPRRLIPKQAFLRAPTGARTIIFLNIFGERSEDVQDLGQAVLAVGIINRMGDETRLF